LNMPKVRILFSFKVLAQQDLILFKIVV
jgi:hypothetical protein